MPYNILGPLNNTLEQLQQTSLSAPFSDHLTGFIEDFCQALYQHPKIKQFPELVALAFWFRRKQLKLLAAQFNDTSVLHLPRGTVFHVAPSNVDTIFIYSWFLSLLVGNRNILRVSQSNSLQVNILIDTINRLSKYDQHKELSQSFLIVNYEHDEEITYEFSSICDMRVIWGGDETVQSIRKIPIKPTATEITFANKFSLSILDAKAILQIDDIDSLANNFYNDAYPFNQMACSSPRLIIWLGVNAEIKDAKHQFWQAMNEKLAHSNFATEASLNMNKLVTSYNIALQDYGVLAKELDQRITRMQLKNLNESILTEHCGGGLFYEYDTATLDTLKTIISRKIQTVGVYGIDKVRLKQWVLSDIPIGIDRIVSIGKALEFSPIWDGFDLLQQFSRIVDINCE